MFRQLFLPAAVIWLSWGDSMISVHGDSLDDTAGREMQAHGIPGLSLAVIHDGRISTRVYGKTKAGTVGIVTPETLFQAASISKVATAIAALGLVQDGKLSLDDDVNLRLKDWKVPESEFTRVEKVTVRRLLDHTAGFTQHGFPGYPWGQPLPALTDILDGTGLSATPAIRVVSVPGSRWQYSGGGYTVLQKLMVDVTGQSFPDLLDARVLQPLHLDHSTFDQPLPASLENSVAFGHLTAGAPLRGRGNVYPELAAAGLWTTPSDLALLVLAIQKALGGKSDGPVNPVIAREMTTPVLDRDGLGLFLSGPGNKIFGHSGRNAGFDSLIRASDTDGVVIMINCNDDTGAVGRICEAAWKQSALNPPWPAPIQKLDPRVDARTYSDFVGRYDYGGAIQDITLEKGHLFAQLTGQNRLEIFPSAPNSFFFRVVEAGLVFQRDQKGIVTSVIHTQNGDSFTAPKLSEKDSPMLSPTDLDAFVGQYRYGPDMVLTVIRRDDQLYAQLTGQAEAPIFPTSDHEFCWKVVPASVEFIRQDGMVTGAIHHQDGHTLHAPRISP